MNIRSRYISLLAATGLAALSLLPAGARAEDADPPSRVARLAFIAGDVSFAPAGEDSWNEASLNRPLITGDRLLTGNDARVALDLGGGEIRVAGGSGFNFLRLDDRNAQIELNKGTLNWRVEKLQRGQNYEIDTPTLAFVITQPGAYRVDVAADGGATTISLLNGAGTVYGEGKASYPLSGRQSWRITDPQLSDVAGMPLAAADDFDRWCGDRDGRYSRSASTRYVSSEVVGASDLDMYGDWDRADDYGEVWYPRTVVVGWAPYRYGHWAWIAPWGWTWIDDAPWGFAPFHYGRWVYVRERWGWMPGPPRVRPVYCPALVAFVGGAGWSVGISSGAPIGWVPLGPRDVYVPWYHGSRQYFTNVNVSNTTIINRTQVTNVYNNVQVNQINNVTYMHQSVPGATTVVTHDAFTHGRAVNGAQVDVDRDELARARPMRRGELPAGRPGQGLQPATVAVREAPSAVFTRPVISHREPPAAALGTRVPVPQTTAISGATPERERPAIGRPPVRGGNGERPVAAEPSRPSLPVRSDDDARGVRGPRLDRIPRPVPGADELPSARYAPRQDSPARPQTPEPRRDNPARETPTVSPHDSSTPVLRGSGAELPRPESRPPRPAQQPLPQGNPIGDAQRSRPMPSEEPRRAPEERPMPPQRSAPPREEREPRPRRQPEPRERPQREHD